MKKLPALLALLQLVWFVPMAQATVAVTNGPTTLVSTPTVAPASSAPIALFKFSLNQDAGETLSGAMVTINKNGTTNLTGADLTSLTVYKDNGDTVFNTASDLLAGSQTAVNIDSPTTINTSTNNTLTGGTTFFITINTSATWSDTAPTDSFTATLGANGITTSSNSPIVTAITTAAITAETTGPVLTSVVAQNTGGTNTKEAGDSVVLTFGEATNKPSITDGNINSTLTLNNSHSWLDGTGHIGSATWNTSGTVLTLTLSAGTYVPTVSFGDTVTISGSVIQDVLGNIATGSQTIAGSFGATSTSGSNEEHDNKICTNSLINGRLYKVTNGDAIYLAAACKLKTFKGKSWGHAKGKKFRNIITLSSLDGITVQQPKPTKTEKHDKIKESDDNEYGQSVNDSGVNSNDRGNGKAKGHDNERD